MSLLLGLQNREQLDSAVADELDQLAASIQVAFNNLASSWVDVPFSAAAYSGQVAMIWTVSAGQQQTFRYLVVGKTMTVTFSFIGGVVSGTPSPGLQVAIPGGYMAAKLSFGSFHYFDAATPSTGLCAVDPLAGAVIRLFKQDLSNWTAGSNQIRGTMVFEVV